MQHPAEAPADEAEQCWADALRQHHSGRLEAAERLYRRVLAADPRHAEALHLLGVLAYQTQRRDLALDLIGQAIGVAPDVALFHANLGNVLEALGRTEEATASHRRSVQLDPRFAEGHKLLGTLLLEQGRAEEAEACLRLALEIRPDFAEAENNLAGLLFRQNRVGEAADRYRRLIQGNQRDAQAHLHLGAALLALDRLEEATAALRQAVALRPDWADALTRLGVAHMRAANPAAAIPCFQAVTRLNPDDPEAHVDLGLALLLCGDMPAGWREFEWRRLTGAVIEKGRDYARPQWRGEPAGHATLLIHAEQGFGDMLQFCRYAPLAHDRGMRVIIEAPAPLLRLLRSLRGVEMLVASGEALPPFDLHCPMLSLPLAFATEMADIPRSVPYLRADPAEAASFRMRLAAAAPADGLRVGLAWAGNPEPEFDRRRSLDPDRLTRLGLVAGVRFVCLQEVAFPRPAGLTLIDLMDGVVDFAATAALVANLDLVISADTAVVHLAGALGKPVWLLNRFDNCWRWLTGREGSPWYPTLRIFRQPRPGDWDSVLADVEAALRALAGEVAT